MLKKCFDRFLLVNTIFKSETSLDFKPKDLQLMNSFPILKLFFRANCLSTCKTTFFLRG